MIEKSNLQQEAALFKEVSVLIEQEHSQVAFQVNSIMTLLFWQVGKRINDFILEHKRAEYGKQIIVTLSRQLEERFGRNFEEKNLRTMLQFAEVFPDHQIVVTLSRHLSWSHFLVLIPLKSEEKKFNNVPIMMVGPHQTKLELNKMPLKEVTLEDAMEMFNINFGSN